MARNTRTNYYHRRALYTKPKHHTRNHLWIKYVLIDMKKNQLWECGSWGDIAKMLNTTSNLIRSRVIGRGKRKQNTSKIVDWDRYTVIKLKDKKLNRDYFRTITPSNLGVVYKRAHKKMLREFKKKYTPKV